MMPLTSHSVFDWRNSSKPFRVGAGPIFTRPCSSIVAITHASRPHWWCTLPRW